MGNDLILSWGYPDNKTIEMMIETNIVGYIGLGFGSVMKDMDVIVF